MDCVAVASDEGDAKELIKDPEPEPVEMEPLAMNKTPEPETAEGVKADLQNYGNQFLQYTRETIARCKDFFLGIFS